MEIFDAILDKIDESFCLLTESNHLFFKNSPPATVLTLSRLLVSSDKTLAFPTLKERSFSLNLLRKG